MLPPPLSVPLARRSVCGLVLALVAGGSALAQLPKPLPKVVILAPGNPPVAPGGAFDEFRSALRDLGWDDGKSIQLDFRFDGYQPRAWNEQVAAAVEQKADVIVAGHTASAFAAKRATSTIPIVFAVSADPVADGLVASLARPGGNLTGLSIMTPEVTAKRLQLLKLALPEAKRIGFFVDTLVGRWSVDQREHEAAANALGLVLVPVKVEGLPGLESAFKEAKREGVQAIVLMQSAVFAIHGPRVAELALAAKLPTMGAGGDGAYADQGGLMNYGASITECWRRSAQYVHRILRGAKPADLPIEQPLRFEFVVNRKTADALGVRLDPSILVQADRITSR